LLISLKRGDEAEILVNETLAACLADAATFDLKARLVYHSKGALASREVINQGLVQFPNNVILKAHSQRLETGGNIPLASKFLTAVQSSSSKVPGSDEELEAVERGGQLRRIAARLNSKITDAQWHSVAVTEVRNILASDPSLDYAQYLLVELGIRNEEGPPSLAGNFATAFVDAMKRKDSDLLTVLASNYPDRSQLLDVARAFLFKDEAAADRAVSWLKIGSNVSPRAVAALRAFITRRLAMARKGPAEVPDGVTFVNIIAANDNVPRDLIEAALVPQDLAFAA
jgi:hypothetical protein